MEYSKEQLRLRWFLDHKKDEAIFRSIHADGNDMILSFLRVEYYSIVHMLHVFMHHLLMDVGCFHVLAIVNNAAVIIGGACTFSELCFSQIYAQEWECWIIW